MIYTIEEGNQYPNDINFGIHYKGKAVHKTVIFYPDCSYDLGDVDQKDINKTYGYTQSLFSNSNSGRLGWRWSLEKQKLEMMGYVHINGIDIKEWEANLFICDVDLGQRLDTYVMDIPGNKYLFKVNEFSLELTRVGSGIGYNEFPFFGGNRTATHQMHIELINL